MKRMFVLAALIVCGSYGSASSSSAGGSAGGVGNGYALIPKLLPIPLPEDMLDVAGIIKDLKDILTDKMTPKNPNKSIKQIANRLKGIDLTKFGGDHVARICKLMLDVPGDENLDWYPDLRLDWYPDLRLDTTKFVDNQINKRYAHVRHMKTSYFKDQSAVLDTDLRDWEKDQSAVLDTDLRDWEKDQELYQQGEYIGSWRTILRDQGAQRRFTEDDRDTAKRIKEPLSNGGPASEALEMLRSAVTVKASRPISTGGVEAGKSISTGKYLPRMFELFLELNEEYEPAFSAWGTARHLIRILKYRRISLADLEDMLLQIGGTSFADGVDEQLKNPAKYKKFKDGLDEVIEACEKDLELIKSEISAASAPTDVTTPTIGAGSSSGHATGSGFRAVRALRRSSTSASPGPSTGSPGAGEAVKGQSLPYNRNTTYRICCALFCPLPEQMFSLLVLGYFEEVNGKMAQMFLKGLSEDTKLRPASDYFPEGETIKTIDLNRLASGTNIAITQNWLDPSAIATISANIRTYWNSENPIEDQDMKEARNKLCYLTVQEALKDLWLLGEANQLSNKGAKTLPNEHWAKYNRSRLNELLGQPGGSQELELLKRVLDQFVTMDELSNAFRGAHDQLGYNAAKGKEVKTIVNKVIPHLSQIKARFKEELSKIPAPQVTQAAKGFNLQQLPEEVVNETNSFIAPDVMQECLKIIDGASASAMGASGSAP